MTQMTHDGIQPGDESAIAGTADPGIEYVVVGDLRPEDDADTCLRPLGLCELGGSCESCWYSPDHPRFHD